MALNFLKKLAAGVCALVIGGTATAGEIFQSGFGVGANISSWNGEDFKAHTRFFVDYDANIKFGRLLYLGTGVGVTMKGFKTLNDDHWNLTFAQIPVNIGARLSFGDVIGIYGQLGPYVGFGFWSNDIIDYDGEGGVVRQNFFAYDDNSRIDFGLNFEVGLFITKFKVEVGYELGLNNMTKWYDDTKNRNFYVGVGMLF